MHHANARSKASRPGYVVILGVLCAAAVLVLSVGPGTSPASPPPTAGDGGEIDAKRPDGPPVAPAPERAERSRGESPDRGTGDANRPPIREEVAEAVLAKHAKRLGLDRMVGERRLRRSFSTIAGNHVRYDQVVDGYVVYASEISVHTAPDGELLIVNADVFPAPANVPEPKLTGDEARKIAAEEARDEADEPVRFYDHRLVLLPVKKTCRLTWLVDVSSRSEALRVFVDALTGDVLETEDMIKSVEGQGRVFDPNPVFSSQNTALRDDFDADSPELTAELVTVALPRLDGSGYLRGKWVDLTPTPDPAHSETNTFSYTRSEPRFEQVMAYYHIDATQQYIRNVLGIKKANSRVQMVDAHHIDLIWDSTWGAHYNLLTGTICLFDLGVDAGEDSDVIVHEYGHAIQENQVKNWGKRHQGQAMGEGFCDYLAATRHESGNPDFDASIGSWWSTTLGKDRFYREPAALRRLDTRKVFPRDMDSWGDYHSDGEIWSGALWEIRSAIGKVDADRIIIASHFYLTPRAKFKHGAKAIIAANRALRKRADQDTIMAILVSRGLLKGYVEVDDQYEENDKAEDAVDLGPGTHALVLMDHDWFAVTLEPGQSLVVTKVGPDVVRQPGMDLYLPGDTKRHVVSDDFGFQYGPLSEKTRLLLRTRAFLTDDGSEYNVVAYTLHIAIFGQPVEPGADDSYEENDTFEDAAEIGPGVYDLYLQDDDFFVVEIEAEKGIVARAEFSHPSPDLELQLYRIWGTSPLLEETSDNEGPVEEVGDSSGSSSPRRYALRARRIGEARGPYRLTISAVERDDEYEENDTFETASRVTLDWSHDFLGSLYLADVDYFRVPLPPYPAVVLSVRTYDPYGDLDLELLNEKGEKLASSEGPSGDEGITALLLGGDHEAVVVRVHATEDTGTYYLAINARPLTALSVPTMQIGVLSELQETMMKLAVDMRGAETRKVKIQAKAYMGVAPRIQVETLDGEVIVPSGKGARKKRTKISFKAEASREYAVKLTNWKNKPGIYVLKIRVR